MAYENLHRIESINTKNMLANAIRDKDKDNQQQMRRSEKIVISVVQSTCSSVA